MKKILLFLPVLVLLAAVAQGATITMSVSWAYNGVNEGGGFRMYAKQPGSDVFEPLFEVADATAREYTTEVEVVPGRTIYSLSAYDEAGVESPRSNGYPFEFIEPETPGLPAPTIIIKFN